jgi:MmyB-like transcription regulator ligand binding domain
MTNSPAFIRNGRLDILAANPLGQALYAPVYTADAKRPVDIARFQFLHPGGAPGPVRDNPPGGRAPGPQPGRSRACGPAAARLWDFLRHAASLDSCVSAGRRAGLCVCSRWAVLGSNQ